VLEGTLVIERERFTDLIIREGCKAILTCKTDKSGENLEWQWDGETELASQMKFEVRGATCILDEHFILLFTRHPQCSIIWV